MTKHVFWIEGDVNTGAMTVCCDQPPFHVVHVPERLVELVHGDRVFARQILTPEAINSILERLDHIEDALHVNGIYR